MYQTIHADKIFPHPENCNRMSGPFLKKLEENIRKTGNYETITVRPLPGSNDEYQILNGHQRMDILRKLGDQEVKCDVWAVSDAEARLLIATLNRLTGNDVPELRFSLLKNLIDDFDISELETLIPENTKQIEELLKMQDENIEKVKREILESSSSAKLEIADLRILDFFLNSDQYGLIIKALDDLMIKRGLKDRNEALSGLATFYLAANRY